MSMSYDDCAWDMYWADKGEEEFLANLVEGSIEGFKKERIQSYFLENTDILIPPTTALNTSRRLYSKKFYSPAVVFAATATEVCLKRVILRPFVYGLVHNESAAELVMKLAQPRGFAYGPFKSLLYELVKMYGNGIELTNFELYYSRKSLWDEIWKVADKRNNIVHAAEQAGETEATVAIEVAFSILRTIIPRILDNIGIEVKQDNLLRSVGSGLVSGC